MRLTLPFYLCLLIAAPFESSEGHAGPATNPPLEKSFRLMYELQFAAARDRLRSCREADPEDPLCVAAEAASYLFEEFNQHGVLTSAFFLNDKRLLGGIAGAPDKERAAAFLEANQRARAMAKLRLTSSPRAADALLTLVLADGMQSDFAALITKRQVESVRLMRRAEKGAAALLQVEPDNGDAYVALGAANYIIGCLPAYKRFVLWLGGIAGDRQTGLKQLQVAATRGHYLKPLAKSMLALAAKREGQFDLARSLFADLNQEFPGQPVFAHELALLKTTAASPRTGPVNKQPGNEARHRMPYGAAGLLQSLLFLADPAGEQEGIGQGEDSGRDIGAAKHRDGKHLDDDRGIVRVPDVAVGALHHQWLSRNHNNPCVPASAQGPDRPQAQGLRGCYQHDPHRPQRIPAA